VKTYFSQHKPNVKVVEKSEISVSVEETGPGVAAQLAGQLVADLCVVGGYAQYAIRPARFLVPVPDGVDPAEAVCIPLAYLTAYQCSPAQHAENHQAQVCAAKTRRCLLACG
jgi:NADPH:quinone reductase-like Zn-dependent oxidoreductase